MSGQVNITVHTTGTCPAGHPVTYDMPVTVVRGSSGMATASATCPQHNQPVSLSDTYTT